MDKYVTGAVIRRLRESRKMTQEELAEKIYVSGKAVSKWETGQGFPDISLLEPLASALGISVIELLSGEDIRRVVHQVREADPHAFINAQRTDSLTGRFYRRPQD